MATHLNLPGPYVIGGVGGSGTRLAAEILIELGAYLGSNLNRAQDQASFAFLFCRPRWFANQLKRPSNSIHYGLDLYTRTYFGPAWVPPAGLGFLFLAYLDSVRDKKARRKSRRLLRPLLDSGKVLFTQRVDQAAFKGWGWKNPNSHIFIHELGEFYPGLKYIHVIRNGLDMAYSQNTTQLFRWEALFNLSIPGSPELLPKAALEYWILSNQRAIRLGQSLGPGRFYLLNYDRLCHSPHEELDNLLEFLGLDNSAQERLKLASLPRISPGMGRYRQQDLSIFPADALEAVRQLGFSVEK